jgi:hypothetical protein
MSPDAENRPRPENRIAGALVALLGATQELAALTGTRETLSLLAREELDTGEIALARNQLNRVLQRIDAEADGATRARHQNSPEPRGIAPIPAKK